MRKEVSPARILSGDKKFWFTSWKGSCEDRMILEVKLKRKAGMDRYLR